MVVFNIKHTRRFINIKGDGKLSNLSLISDDIISTWIYSIWVMFHSTSLFKLLLNVLFGNLFGSGVLIATASVKRLCSSRNQLLIDNIKCFILFFFGNKVIHIMLQSVRFHLI